VRLRLAAFAALVALVLVGGHARAASSGHDWPMFGWSPDRANSPTFATGITAANVGSLTRQQVQLDGTVDASPIYLHGVRVRGTLHDVFFVTTTYGRTEAIDGRNGSLLWRFTPPGYSSWSGSPQITTATPVADPGRAWIYAASPGGRIYKLSVATGRPAWAVAVTRRPSREKIAAALNFSRGNVIATTGGYIGDAPPYQGHVAVIRAGDGKLLQVWNSLCSDRRALIVPSSCGASDSAIWGRAGAVVDPANGELLVATGNGPWNGSTNWGDAVLRLAPDATALLGNYTPTNTAELEQTDADLGSTSPALLGGGYIAQGGKDGKIRVLSVKRMSGRAPHKGGEVDVVSTPSGGNLFTAPAVWRHGSTTLLIAADGGGTAAWRFSGGHLQLVWHNGTPGTSPVVAGGLLWIYNPNGGLAVYVPGTGRLLTTLDAGTGHWNSPIVADGRVALPEGNANSHATSGVLDIWRLK
jgi:hypothetical protein